MRVKLLLVLCVLATVAGAAQAPAYDAHDKRDPFEALITSTGEPREPHSGGAVGTIHLEGIMWDTTNPLAIVNGEVFRVGDSVVDFYIIQIKEDAMVISTDALAEEHGGETIVIPVVTEEIRAGSE